MNPKCVALRPGRKELSRWALAPVPNPDLPAGHTRHEPEMRCSPSRARSEELPKADMDSNPLSCHNTDVTSHFPRGQE